MKLIIVFGLSGSGKTYIGNLMEEKFDFLHLDGDALLPLSLKQKIDQEQHFTPEERNQFIKILIDKIKSLERQSENKIVLSQGLYLNKAREQIKQAFPKAIFFQVNANDTTIKARIKDRFNAQKSKVTPEYAEKISKFFEPMLDAYQIDNSLDERHLYDQIFKILNSL